MEGEAFENQERREPPKGKLLIYIIGGLVLFGAANALAFSDGYRDFISKTRGVLTGSFRDAVSTSNMQLRETIDLNSKEAVKVPAQSKKTIAENFVKTVGDKVAATSASIKGEAQKIVATSLPNLFDFQIATAPPPDKLEIQVSTSTVVAQEEALKPVLIYIVQIAGTNNTDEDFISLFNPNWKTVDMSGWRLVRKTKTGTEDSIKVFPDGSKIPPKGKFVWANSSFISMDANVRTSDKLAKDNSVALLDQNKKIIDSLGWGSGLNQFLEGSPAPNPKVSLERKLDQDSMPIDTGDNLSDFEIK